MNIPSEIITQELVGYLDLDAYLSLRAVNKTYRTLLFLPDLFTVFMECLVDSAKKPLRVTATLCLGDCGVLPISPFVREKALLMDWREHYVSWYDTLPRSEALQAYHWSKYLIVTSSHHPRIDTIEYTVEVCSSLEREGLLTEMCSALGPLRPSIPCFPSPEEIDETFITDLIGDVSYSVIEDDYSCYLSLDEQGTWLGVHAYNPHSDTEMEEYYVTLPEDDPTLFIMLNPRVDTFLLYRQEGDSSIVDILSYVVNYVTKRMNDLKLPFSINTD